MYAPSNWQAWLSDGLAHANLVMMLWCAANVWRNHRRLTTPPLRRYVSVRDYRWVVWGGCFAALLNGAIALMHLRVWQWQMGY